MTDSSHPAQPSSETKTEGEGIISKLMHALHLDGAEPAPPVNIHGTISRAVQAGVPLDLVKQALDKNIDVNNILDKFLRDERPNRWSPHKVKQVKEAILCLLAEPILDKTGEIGENYKFRIALLLDVAGITHPEPGFAQFVADAKQHFAIRD